MIENTWYISLAECARQLDNEEKYGYGLLKRRIKRFQNYNRDLFAIHRESYYRWLDLFVYKILRGEGFHAPIYTMEPRYEQEKAYDWWRCYFSYGWQGAKTEKSPVKFE